MSYWQYRQQVSYLNEWQFHVAQAVLESNDYTPGGIIRASVQSIADTIECSTAMAFRLVEHYRKTGRVDELFRKYCCKREYCPNTEKFCIHHNNRHWKLTGDLVCEWNTAIMNGNATMDSVPIDLLHLIHVCYEAQPGTAPLPQPVQQLFHPYQAYDAQGVLVWCVPVPVPVPALAPAPAPAPILQNVRDNSPSWSPPATPVDDDEKFGDLLAWLKTKEQARFHNSLELFLNTLVDRGYDVQGSTRLDHDLAKEMGCPPGIYVRWNGVIKKWRSSR